MTKHEKQQQLEIAKTTLVLAYQQIEICAFPGMDELLREMSFAISQIESAQAENELFPCVSPA